MPSPSYTYTLTNGNTADASQVTQNFNDILNGVTDGTKDLSISALTCAGTSTLNGNVNIGNASSDDLSITASLASSIAIKTNNSYDIGSSTLGIRKLYLGNGGAGATCDIVSASHATTREYTIPDCSAAASFVMTQSAQTIAGQLTLSSALLNADGTNSLPGVSFSSDTNTGMYRAGADQIGFTAGGTANLTITNGNIRLKAASSGFGNSSSPGVTPSDDTDSGIYFVGADQWGISSGGTRVWETDSGGRLGVGGAATSTGEISLYVRTTTALKVYGAATSGVEGHLAFHDGAGTSCGNIQIDATANTTTYVTSSDERLKTNFQDFDGLSIVNKIQALQYERISQPGVLEYGVKAQQLYEVYPKAASVGGENPDTNPWGVDYSKLVGILLRAVQQLSARIESAANPI